MVHQPTYKNIVVGRTSRVYIQYIPRRPKNSFDGCPLVNVHSCKNPTNVQGKIQSGVEVIRYDISEILVVKMLETNHPSDLPSNDFPGHSIKISSRPKPVLVKYPQISVQYTKHVHCKTCLFQFTFQIFQCVAVPLKKKKNTYIPANYHGYPK